VVSVLTAVYSVYLLFLLLLSTRPLSNLKTSANFNIGLPGRLDLFGEESPLCEDFFSLFLLRKEKSNAAYRSDSDSKYEVGNNEHQLDEKSLLSKIPNFLLVSGVRAQEVSTAHPACISPPPKLHKDKQSQTKA
jgi:hypothetical protein